MKKHLIVFLIPALFLGLFSGPQAAGAEPATPDTPILLKARVLIDGPVVRLSDLFDGLDGPRQDLGQTAIARAPEPGRRVEVNARWLLAVAQAYGISWRPRSRYETVMIERASLVIDNARIEAATIEALAARGASGRLSVVFDNPSMRLHLPLDAPASLAITGLTYHRASGRFIGQVVSPAEGTPAVRATISGRAVEMTDIPVLARRVEPGEVIKKRDIVWTSTRADRLNRGIAMSPERLLGKSPRRPIRAGEAIQSADLRDPILVEKNTIVTIRLESPRMVLTVQGRALDHGAAGDVIRVMNTKSKTIVDAAVTRSGVVRVYTATLAGIGQEGFK